VLQAVGTNGVLFRWVNYGASTSGGNWYLRDGSAAGNDLVINGQLGTLSTLYSGTGIIGINEAGSATFSGAIINQSSATLTAAANGIATFSGVISGDGSITKNGSGTVILANNNTYKGATTISSGTLQIGDGGTSGSIGSTSGVSNGGTLAYNRSDNLTAAYAISGGGNMIKNGGGVLTLSGANSYSGGTLLNAGALALSNDSALGTGTVTIGDGTSLGSVGTRRLIANAIVVAGNFSMGLGDSATTFTSAGSMDLGGATRTISLSNAVTFSNAISNGGLRVNNANVSPTNTLSINLGAANTFAGGVVLSNYVLLRLDTTNAAGTGTIAQANGTSVVQVNVAGTITNNMSLYSLRFTTNAELSGAIVLNNTVFDVTNNVTATNSGTLSGTGGVDKIGAGTLVLSATNTFTGGIAISNGAVSISADNNLGAVPLWPSPGNVTFDLGKLLVTESFTLNSNRGLAMGVFGGTIEVAIGKSFAYEGVAAGSGALTKSGNGTLTLSGANTYTGATTLSAGTLELANTSGAALGSTASLGVASGATLLVSQSNQVNNSASVSLTGGTIRTASGVSEVFGNLSVISASFLDFGTTSYANANTIGFGTYTTSALLAINNFNFGSTMTFKSNLSSAELATFSFTNGGIASSGWDSGTSTFTITAIPEPSTYLAAVGLIGLILWSLRRRGASIAKRF
jgi:autotransporter-associated beta strand protein